MQECAISMADAFARMHVMELGKYTAQTWGRVQKVINDNNELSCQTDHKIGNTKMQVLRQKKHIS